MRGISQTERTLSQGSALQGGTVSDGEGWGPAPRSCSLAGLRCWTAERVWREKAQKSLADVRSAIEEAEEYERQRGASYAR
jgi:hypothetical protein